MGFERSNTRLQFRKFWLLVTVSLTLCALTQRKSLGVSCTSMTSLYFGGHPLYSGQTSARFPQHELLWQQGRYHFQKLVSFSAPVLSQTPWEVRLFPCFLRSLGCTSVLDRFHAFIFLTLQNVCSKTGHALMSQLYFKTVQHMFMLLNSQFLLKTWFLIGLIWLFFLTGEEFYLLLILKPGISEFK